eukprot:EG_transcript_32
MILSSSSSCSFLILIHLFAFVSGECVDDPGWADSDGSTCANYTGLYCSRGGGYINRYETNSFYDYSGPLSNNRSAFGACCGCGANRDVVGCTTVELYITAGQNPYFFMWYVLEAREAWPVVAKYGDPYRRYLEPLCLLPGNYTFWGTSDYITGGSAAIAWGSLQLMPTVALAGTKTVPFSVPPGSGQCFREGVQCGAHARCIDTAGGYDCRCEPGFEKIEGQCSDVNECFGGTSQCDTNAYCNNTVGFYNCICNPGFVGDGRTFCLAAVANRDVAGCTTVQVDLHTSSPAILNGAGVPQEMGWRIDEAVPLLGYGYDFYTQLDIQYPPVYVCLLPGTYTIRLQDRFGDGWGDGWLRVHINGTDLVPRTGLLGVGSTVPLRVPISSGQCFLHHQLCQANAACVDTATDFVCTCSLPYVGSGDVCGDPCANSSLCQRQRHQVCVNVNATGHRCDCTTGFVDVSGSCQDVDECQQPDACAAHAVCANNEGSYNCTCQDGYYGYDLQSTIYNSILADSCAALSRDIPGCVTVAVHVLTDAHPEQISWAITGAVPPVPKVSSEYRLPPLGSDPGPSDANGRFVHAVCLRPGPYTFVGRDSARDGWTEGGFSVTYGGQELVPFTAVVGPSTSVAFLIPNGTGYCQQANPCGTAEVCLDTPNGTDCVCQSGYARNSGGVCTGCTTFELRVTSDLYPHQMAWQILDGNGDVATFLGQNFMLVANWDYLFTKCLPGGNYTFVGTDSFGDGWTTGGFRINVGPRVLVSQTAITGYRAAVPFAIPFSSGACGADPYYKPCIDTLESCVDTADFLYCNCRPGTLVNDTTGECDDIDECQAGTHNCHPNATCTNIVGYFICTCNPGHWGNGTDCHGKNRDVPGCTQLSVQINAGQYPNEMAWGIVEAYPEMRVPVGTYTAPFAPHTVDLCLLPGTYTFDVYDRYGDGWDNGTFAVQYGIRTLIQPTEVVLFGFGTTLLVPPEVDECAAGSHNCNPNAICTNLPSTFSCQCKEGYYGNGVSCNGPEDFASCADLAGWADANGYTCDDYAANHWCSDWWYGAAWNFDWGTFHDFRPANGVGADQACCGCGLSRSPVQAVDCAVREWGPWGDCVVGDSGNCTATRQRAVAALPTAGGAPCPALTETVPCATCPRCSVGEWGDWACHSPGLRLRSRSLLTAPQGSLCADLGELRHAPGCLDAGITPTGYLGQTFGRNSYGQLGLNDRISRSVAEFALPSPLGLPIQQLQLGGDHSAAIAGGLLFTWGRNDYGQLGLGDKVQRLTPCLVPVTPRAKFVALGGFHTAVILDDGTLWTFGRNDFGQLGRQGDRSQPRKVIIPVIKGSPWVVTVALGRLHTALVVQAGQVYVCGNSTGGQLGDGGSDNAGTAFVASPVLVPLLTALQRNVTQVALGDTHTAFLTSLGELFLAGENEYNQLGTEASTTPVLMLNTSQIHSIAAGAYHTAVLMQNGSLLAFGRNDWGQLGVPNHTARTSAVPLLVTTDAVAVALGAFHSAYLTARRELMVFGANDQGQLGTGGPANVSRPTALSSTFGGAIAAFSLGGSHTAVLRAATPTPTLTATGTATGTPTASPSTTPTPTPIPVLCNASAVDQSIADSSVAVTTGIPCVQHLQLGTGSSDWQTRFLVLSIAQLQGTFSVLLTGGCVTGCAFSYGSGHQGTTQRIPLPTRAALGLQLAYSAPAATSGSARRWDPLQQADEPPGAAVTLSIESEGTANLLLACAVSATALVFLPLGAWLCAGLWWVRHPRAKGRPVDPRWAGIAFGLSLLLVGAAYLVIAAVTSNPIGPLALIIAGSVLAGVGVPPLLWGLWDPTAHSCYGCKKPVSHWRFRGTYLPSLLDALHPPRKAHTKCARCVKCRKPVVLGGWEEAPPQRPYHAKCWKVHCEHMCVTTELKRWLQCGSPTNVELAHMLAVAIDEANQEVIDTLKKEFPNSVKVSQQDGKVAVHLAARAGNPALQLLLPCLPCLRPAYSDDPTEPPDPAKLASLLWENPGCLEPAWTQSLGGPPRSCISDPERWSIAIPGHKSLDDGLVPDLYVVQPFISYNGQPVYIGADHGWYIFYFDAGTTMGVVAGASPVPTAGNIAAAATGTAAETNVEIIAEATAEAGAQTGVEAIAQASVTTTSAGAAAGTTVGTTAGVAQPTNSPTLVNSGWYCSANLGSVRDAVPLTIQNTPAAVPAPTSRPRRRQWLSRIARRLGRHPVHPMDAVATQPAPPRQDAYLAVQDTPLEWVPHATSLMDEAVASSPTGILLKDEDDLRNYRDRKRNTIKYIKELYRLRDPGCVTWKQYVGHNNAVIKNQAFSLEAQLEIWEADRQHSNHCKLATGNYAAEGTVLNLQKLKVTTQHGSSNLKTCLRTVVLYQDTDAMDAKWAVCSLMNSLQPGAWHTAVVLFTPGYVDANRVDSGVLESLRNEGVVDFALWKPPCKVEALTQVQWSEAGRRVEPAFQRVLEREVAAAQGTDDKPARDSSRRGTEGPLDIVATGFIERINAEPTACQGELYTKELYTPGTVYFSDIGTLPFCEDLPYTDKMDPVLPNEDQATVKQIPELEYIFQPKPIEKMAADALMKAHELQRQQPGVSPRHVVAIFVYTYELLYPQKDKPLAELGPTSDPVRRNGQIYSVINAVMRAKPTPKTKNQITFWSPLISEIDMALQGLPVFHGEVYRGVKNPVERGGYQIGKHYEWRGFSSTSRSKRKAETFVHNGTLFFLTISSQVVDGPRRISKYSRYPDEDEVVFRPNSAFTVTLPVTRDKLIARDNLRDEVQMDFREREQAPTVGHTAFVLRVPDTMVETIPAMLSHPNGRVRVCRLAALPGFAAELVLEPRSGDAVSSTTAATAAGAPAVYPILSTPAACP